MIETKKKLKELKSNFIKDRMFLFLRATVSNPVFNSQTKEQLTTASKDFGCSVTVSDKFIEKLYKSSITEEIVEFCKLKEASTLNKQTDGKKVNKVYVPKLEDALWAGTKRSSECTLMLTEGDSANTFAKWGRAIVGIEKYATYPLKGKSLNIRDATIDQLINNEEINNIKKIMGLKNDKVYKDTSELRYGKIMLLTDSDVDGAHIRCLLVNMFHYWWPNLLKIEPNFIQTLRTPIVKAIKGKKVVEFFNEQDYNKWKESGINVNSFNIRYYKGLGTSTKEDAKDIFKRLETLKIEYYYKDAICDESILLAFDKDKNKTKSKPDDDLESNASVISLKCTDKRKEWLSNYDKNSYIDMKQSKVSFQDLINKDLIHFSIYDNMRSIPSLCDGLKPSQRKILFYMMEKGKRDLIKVAQLSGYVSAETGYHHGEMSLQGAIINMAQDYIGSNNISLLKAEGNFGTRYLNGKDASSPRYIFTKLKDITGEIFNKLDSPLLEYINDEGKRIEPGYYVPIIPMILVNGCEGIGTGYSTFVPQYNPKDIIDRLRKMLADEDYQPTNLVPYYRGYSGVIQDSGKGIYTVKGKYLRISDNVLKITEIPIGMGVSNYKEFLESFILDNSNNSKKKDTKKSVKKFILNDVKNKTTDEDTSILFEIEFRNKSDLDDLIKSNRLEKELKLVKTISTNNMYLFNEHLILTKYNTPEDILVEFFDIRIEYYVKRKRYLLEKYRRELVVIKAKIRFITEYINSELDINRRSKEHIISLLSTKEYPTYEGSYDYLMNLPMYSLSLEKITDLENQRDKKQSELDFIKSKNPQQLWLIDLDNLEKLI